MLRIIIFRYNIYCSLLGNNYAVAASDYELEYVSGTSASTPVFAAMISIINSLRADLNLSSVGFINPALYSMYYNTTSPFNDITSGDNSCSDRNSVVIYLDIFFINL